jgi:hypothetical protein
MTYNDGVRVLGFYLILLTILVNASRSKVSVDFTDLPASSVYVPFSVVVPADKQGEFLRFIHPRNGKSAVAKVVARKGNRYKISAELGPVIGVQGNGQTVLFIEEVY